MTDELRLPARRDLPPEVRIRLRATVAAGLARAALRHGPGAGRRGGGCSHETQPGVR
jgi:hypothetical protein